MKTLRACIWAEILKFLRSKIGWITLAVFFGFSLMLVKNSSFGDIPIFFYIVGHVGFSIIGAWIFGREFVNGTAADLLALPFARSTVVVSKIIVLILVTAALSAFHFAASSVVLLIVPHSESVGWRMVAHYAVQQGIMALILIALCMPIFFLSLCSRGYFLPIAVFLVLFLWVGIDGGKLPFAMYSPWCIPLIYVESGMLRAYDVVILLVMGVGGLLASLAWWRYADHT
jgi:ABC-2 type transport system permease protein